MRLPPILSIVVIAIIIFNSCSKDATETEIIVHDTAYISKAGTLIDERDGEVYKTVQIGEQVWMAENLKYEIPDSSVCYEYNSSNCFIYGRLYQGDASQRACPEGWHLPSVEEWETLVNYLGGSQLAGLLLQPGAEFGTKKIGFDVLPAGRFATSFVDVGTKAYFMTSTPGGYPSSYRIISVSAAGDINNFGSSSITHQSCRCIKD